MSHITDLRSIYNRLILLLRNANVEYHKRKYGIDYYREGIDLLSTDWDNLLLMDACRYDMFADRFDHSDGDLFRRQSRGSMTAQFLEANFRGRDATDIVYVTANPMLRRIENAQQYHFHTVIDVWQDSGWNKDHGTVMPETVVDHAKVAAEKYPNKRLFIHFMQPHFPFVNSDTNFDKQIPDPSEGDELEFWKQLRTGKLKLSPQQVWKPYNENLDILLPEINTLLNDLDGKTVVTSDHGNMVGDRSRPIPVSDWGHPRGLYTPELIDIPWFVHDTGSRKKIVSEESEDMKSIDRETVQERLRNLGYTE